MRHGQKLIGIALLLSVGWLAAAAETSIAAEADSPPLLAGAATIDITPPPGYRMSGYFSERFNTGVRDPLLAKALVFRQGEQQAALVCCDLIGLSLEVSSAAREQASQATGIPVENIVITATHSHTGPLYKGSLRNFFHARAVAEFGRDPHEKLDYPKLLADRLASVVHRASLQAEPVRLAAGVAEERRLSYNRRFHMRDGTVRFNPGQQNPAIVRPAGPIDPDVGLLYLASEQGKPLATLTVFALHLDTLGGTLYSADYPRYVSDAVQAKLGPEAVSLFGAGTCGDINHVNVAIQGRRTTEEIGGLLGETVVAGLPKLAPQRPSLAVRSGVVQAPRQVFSDDQVQAARDLFPKIGTRELAFLEQVEIYKIVDSRLRPGETLPLEVQAFRLSDETAVVTLPGEVFVELGLEIKRQSPFRHTLVIELANDAPSYIPTRKAFAEGSYETVNSLILPGGGELLVEMAAKLLQELR